MAHLIRLVKPSSQWTTHELRAFHIEVREVDVATFFGLPQLPDAPVSDIILNNTERPVPWPAGMTNSEKIFFDYLSIATCAPEESAILDLSQHLLDMLDYRSEDGLFRTNRALSFYMGHKPISATSDVTLMRDNYCLLVVGTHESIVSAKDPEPPLIAQSIAAFATNRLVRENEPYGIPSLSSQAVPGMTMVGTSPTFYRTIATESLLSALDSLTYPSEPTVVLKFVPPVPNPPAYPTAGMVPVDNRRVIFQCLEAFKGVIGDGL